MKPIRKLFLFTAVILLGAGGIYTYSQLNDGFSLYQMSSSLPPCPQFEMPLTAEKKQELQTLFDQPFHYIGKGCQCYAFESADKQYVVKFLKHKHLRTFSWLEHLPLPHKLHLAAEAKIARRKERVQNLFSSFSLAYAEMSEEAQLIYIHLNRVPAVEKRVVLIDKLGMTRRVSIDRHEFILQKRALLVEEVFAKYLDDEAKLKELLQQLVDLVITRCEKGICNRDPSFVQNVAFAPDESCALFIDIGQFYKDSKILDKEEQQKELNKRLHSLRYWTGRYFPSKAALVDELCEQQRGLTSQGRSSSREMQE